MQDMNALAVRYYFRIYLRNGFRNMRLGNLDVLAVSLEMFSEISVKVEDFLVSYQTINLMYLFWMFTILKSHRCMAVAGTSDTKWID